MPLIKKKSGNFFVQLSFLSLCFLVILLSLFLGVIFSNGLKTFWVSDLIVFEMKDGEKILGEKIQTVEKHTGEIKYQIKVANRDIYGEDFRWIYEDNIKNKHKPKDAMVLERKHNGNLFAFLNKSATDLSEKDWQSFEAKNQIIKVGLPIYNKLRAEVSEVSEEISLLKKKIKKLKYYKADQSKFDPIQKDIAKENEKFDVMEQRMNDKYRELESVSTLMWDLKNNQIKVSHFDIVRSYRPNRLTFYGKSALYCSKVIELLFSEPRESNTEGGLFPAIFGTVLLVFMMSIASFPLGVIAGIYLKEYAKDGVLVKMTRIAVNNLAGIPSIVFGIFGLGFFIYGIGGSIDKIFFPEMLPTPTFGTGGMLWASLTLGVLTVPIVIVSTEEALGVIPSGLRQAATALGANKFQVLTKILLPMASPGIMTGFILAMSRAAGEVAPLMITGVVKLAPELLVSTTFPYMHIERKFMHLGFHIYDVGFQSPNVEAALPMVYVATLLLLLIIISLCSFAIYLRSSMRKKFSGSHL